MTAYLKGKVQNAQRITLSPQAKQAFVTIKQALANAAYLAHPADNATLSLRTDASCLAFGAILEQTVQGNTEVLGYFSKTTADAQCCYSAYDLELLSMYSAVKYFEYLLLDKSFIIYTDNKSLVNSFSKPSENHTSKHVQQLSYLSQFDCTLRHLPGVDNAAADCLPRVVSSVNHIFPLEKIPVTLQEIASMQKNFEKTDAQLNFHQLRLFYLFPGIHRC